ncbi:hypothetical protein F3Y22_tig00110221pilonHSYRG00046 [Hibiscus syriacus]|uniref:Uncharacterized protein n=1 Tax=Hibiscus syriacus TaxID=106335 RepID=A0A6A3B958_HIBSY|nr:hypothetical protein F3Y22_tig00110221pilonHSYRG00046 [Hibiscus syriacus]
MAFSQLEIVSSSPFGCVLRDHNRKERCRDNNVKSVFDKNFNDLVRDHINGCISLSSPQGPQNRHVHKAKNNNPPASTIPSRPPSVLDRWVTWKSQDVALSNTNRHVNEAAETFLDPSQSYSNTALPNTPMPSPSCSRTLGARETERVRIVDIIKKLKNGEHEHSNKEHKHCSTSDQAERRCFSMVRNTPLLRGRQAVHDLLKQIERDKKRELDSLVQHHAVSKFSQRGRLQLMLRLRSLQRCRTIQDSCRPQLPAGQLNRPPQESMHLREKFRAGAESLMAQKNVLAAWRCFQKDKNSTGNPQEREDTHFRKGDRSSWPVNRFLTNKNEDIHEQAKPFSDSIQQKTSIEARCCDSPKIAKPRTPLKGKSKNEVSIKQGSNSQQHPFLGSRETVTRNEGSHEQAKPFSDSIQLKTRLEARCCESPKIAKPRTPLKGKSKNEVYVKQGSNSQQHLFLGSQETVTRNEDIHEQGKPFSDSIQLKTWLEARCCESPKIAKPRTPLKGKLKNEMSIKQGFNSQQHLFLGSQETVTRNEDIHEQAKSFSDSIQHKTRLEARCSESPKIAKPRTPLKRQLENEVTIRQGSNSQEHLFLGSQETAETATQNEVAKLDQEKDQHHFCLELQGTMESSTSLNFSVENEIGEEEGNYHHQHLKLQSQSQDTVENENSEEESNGHHQHLGPESQSQDTVENEIGEEEGDGHHQHLGLDFQSQDTVENEIGEEEGNDNRQHPELDSQSQDALEKSTTYYINDSNENEVPEEEDDQYQQYFEESNEYDWFSNISRPKRYWESIRKAWYNEVLNTAPKNEDIRELVQRGRVSTLLVSDFRESMDQLLTCRVQIQVDLAESHQDVEDMEGTISRERVSNLICSDFVERMKRLITSRAQSQADGAESQREVEGKIETIEPMCSLQTNLHREGDQGEEQEEEDDNDNDEEERSLSSHECQQEVEGKEETIQPMCCLQTNLHSEGDQGEEEEEEEEEEERSLSSHECQQEVEGKEETLQPMCCQQTNLHPEGDQGAEEQEDDGDDEYEGEEERSLSSHEYHEANNYCDHSSSSFQMPSPDVMVTRSWSSQDDNETGNDYQRGASEFSPPPQQSQAPCFQDAIQSSSTNRPSLEMELIYDLKGGIEQLHLEMSELRKSFQSCMGMQMKMHQYAFNQKVHLGET